jgi:hypothetical protein
MRQIGAFREFQHAVTLRDVLRNCDRLERGQSEGLNISRQVRQIVECQSLLTVPFSTLGFRSSETDRPL